MKENRPFVRILLACALAASLAGSAARPAQPAVSENYDWRDGKTLALEGRGFPNSDTPYERLPAKWKGVVPDAVWRLSHTSIDINTRFVTDSDEVVVRWEVKKGYRPHSQITLDGTQGVDVYRREADGTWTHCLAGAPNVETGLGELRVPWKGGAECLVYLPMRVSPLSFSIGVNVAEYVPAFVPAVVPPRVSWFSSNPVHVGDCSAPV